MRRAIIPLLAMPLAGLFGDPQPALSQAPELHYRVVPDFLKLPSDLYLGEAVGVAVNSKGHIFVFSRGNSTGPAYGAAAAQLLEFDVEGKFLREIGHNLYAWPHSVKVDQEDNIWVADKGSDISSIQIDDRLHYVDDQRPAQKPCCICEY